MYTSYLWLSLYRFIINLTDDGRRSQGDQSVIRIPFRCSCSKFVVLLVLVSKTTSSSQCFLHYWRKHCADMVCGHPDHTVFPSVVKEVVTTHYVRGSFTSVVTTHHVRGSFTTEGNAALCDHTPCPWWPHTMTTHHVTQTTHHVMGTVGTGTDRSSVIPRNRHIPRV